jgi:5-methyltetrahydrofolate--homocysteine methyltransferase
MLIVGELINASRKQIREAIEAEDFDAIAGLAAAQREAGADYIDVNAGVFVDREPELLVRLVETVQQACDAPCCLDSPNPAAIEAALKVHKGPPPMINSISLEKNRYDVLLPLAAGSDVKVIALCMSDEGMPETADQRLAIADRLVDGLLQNNVDLDNIHVDPLVQPVATNSAYGEEFLAAVQRIMAGRPGVHTMCGLSNVSFGLPARKFLNQSFLLMAAARGLDGAIINPLDKRMMANVAAAGALSGSDSFCMEFLKAYRAGKLPE